MVCSPEHDPREHDRLSDLRQRQRGLAMTNVLVAGYDAYSVIGGTGLWTSAGYPIVMGSRRNAA